MRCPACGEVGPDGGRYCRGCGVRVMLTCPACGLEAPPGSRFCGTCGTAVGSAGAEDQAAVPTRTMGEIKQVTVLFADIAGSTELVSRLDPEQAMERLYPAVATMCEAVRHFEGTVIRTLGDGIMALFGAPRAQEGHALLACRAALEIQQAFPPKNGGISVRIGLHSGAVVADAPLADVTGERSVYGVTAHVASRLQAIADPGAVFLTGECYRLVRPYCDVRPLGGRTLRGISTDMEVYQLLGTRAAVASQRFQSVALTSFRGRGHELGVLQHLMQAAAEGKGSVAGISGAPGMGKSRLCYEFAKWCRGQFIPVLEGRAHPYGYAVPLQPVLEFMRTSLLRLLPSADAAATRRRIEARLSGLKLAKADLFVLYEFLGVSDGAAHSLASSPRLTPKARHERLLDIIRQMVRAHGGKATVMIIEDLHWLDEASEAFVAAAADAVDGTRMLLVLNYRPSYAVPWMRNSRFHEIALTELPASAMDALVGELVGSRAELAGLRLRVAERSGGNPFFAEELLRSLAEEGVLAGEQGDRMLGRTARRDTLPTTVQAAIGARLDHLSTSERTVLQIGSIIGKEFPLALLRQVTGLSEQQVSFDLGKLCDAELLQPLPADEGRRYAFRHPLIQEVAYATQLKARRDAMHASIAKAMEVRYVDRLNEFAALLAHHHEAAGHIVEAARHMARAARWVGSNSPAQATQHWRKVRELLQTQPASREVDALRIMSNAQIAWLGWREGLTADAAQPFIEEAITRAHQADDSLIPLLLFVDARIAGASDGGADTYAARIRDALSLLKPGRDDGRAATLNAALSQAYAWAGLLREALAANDAALAGTVAIREFDQDFLGFSVERWAAGMRTRILVRLGLTKEAERCIVAALGPGSASEDPAVRFIPHLASIDLAWHRGDSSAANFHAARVSDLAAAHGSSYLRVYAHAATGTAQSIACNFSEAVEDFERALHIVRSTKAANEAEAELLANLADAFLRLGEHQSATTLATEALRVARRRDARLPECRACITLALASAMSGGPTRHDMTTTMLQRAKILIDVTGARIYERLIGEATTVLAF